MNSIVRTAFGQTAHPATSGIAIVCICLAVALLTTCGSKTTDPRTVIPGDALVYIESPDIGKTLAAITENPNFQKLAKRQPDLSSLQGVRASIAVTGFEISAEPITEENAVIDWQPRIVAAVETNAWSWQTKKFVEDKLGEFVNEFYGGEMDLEVTTRKDGEFYVWTSREGAKKAYALQQGSLLFFGNDESAIERCQAVKRGEIASIAASGKVPEGERLAFGYMSTEGVGQISNIVGMYFAKSSGEEEEVQSFVAQVLPEILRNAVREVTWTAVKSEDRIEDKIRVALDDESARVFDETIVPSKDAEIGLANFVPVTATAVTRYLLNDPQVAWRSIVLTSQKKTDALSGAHIAAFSGSVFESYGVENAETFLTSVGRQILTVRIGPDSDNVVVVGTARDPSAVKRSLAREINIARVPEKQFEADVWRSEDGELAAGFFGDRFVAGAAEVVLKCLEARHSNSSAAFARELSGSDAAVVTVGAEDASPTVVNAFFERQNEAERVVLAYTTETRFNKNGLERRTLSDFGLIGWMIERLVPE